MPAGGGGYLDNCKKIENRDLGKIDPRLQELKSMRIPSVWLRVAEVNGVDYFLSTWSILSADSSVADNNDRVYVPRISSYIRFQRNRLISTLDDAGHCADHIRGELLVKSGIDMAVVEIKRIIKKQRKKKCCEAE